ncbi:hypothetical protein SAMN05443572_1101 [Myxococcus fulvus]|uniref:Uncharacterized protein n=1 Tax=Myxococcus fulvus TaxID=33 RepID=A0A511T8C3_MYXFU|nr:hypothetical protein [Myxococcus fulvus]GEN10399.1 hypothetical protein MFU01_54360 [Myxococcus fulvus]SEU34115.1 hypothetical protein SAMN05443572_1101 [Myxococcus fulvus]
MTAAYELFLREVDAHGRERADGFSLGNLRHLTMEEHIQVLATLTRLLSEREDRAPVALAILAPTPETLTLLRKALPLPWKPGVRPEYFDLEVASALGVLTGEPMALDLLEDTVARIQDQWAKGIATEGLRRASPSSDASARLARLIRARPRESMLLDAAEMLMTRHGLWAYDLTHTEERLTLLRALTGDDDTARDEALRRVLSAPVKPWP